MIEVRKKMQAQLQKMEATTMLFRVDLSGSQVWTMYLKSFSKEDDPVFRDLASSTHNCNLCNNFLRRYGNIVAIDSNNEIITLFDFDIGREYKNSMAVMSATIKDAQVENVFFETLAELNSLPYGKTTRNTDKFRLGMETSYKRYTKAEAELYGVVKENEDRTFNHFSLMLDKAFVDMSGNSIEAIQAGHRDAKNVFQRAMEEIPMDTLKLVRDLIKQGSLLDGETHLHKVEKFIPFKKAYDKLAADERDNWCWVTSRDLPFAKFKNELIGVLCSELAEGKELNAACQSWNKRVDPANYMKAKAPITKKQIAEAKAFVVDNGYEASFARRHANVDDIKASEIKHISAGDGTIDAGPSIFDNVKSTSTRHKRSEMKIETEVTIDTFLTDILPECTGVEVYLQNHQEGNLVTMTTSGSDDSKPIFKWANNYSWTYSGNLAGKSMIKDAVASQGGAVDGDLRFSIMWCGEGSKDNSDLDAHCVEPNGNTIYYNRSRSPYSGGVLDIDIQNPLAHKTHGKRDVIENITFPSKSKLQEGTYTFRVHQYSARGSEGFLAEIEFGGDIFSYKWDKPIDSKNFVDVAKVTVKNGKLSIEHLLPETNASKEMYGLETKEFHKVNLVCLSPNHWGENNTGNKHVFFMLDGCKSDKALRSFHVENLNADLLDHRKVMEVLGNTNMLEPTSGKELSGLGFNTTVRDEVIVKCSGSFKRVIKIKF